MRKDALGHRVRVSFVVFFSELSSLLYKLVHFMQASGSMCVLHRHAWRVQWGTPMTRHVVNVFRRAGGPVERQVVHAGVHMFFFPFFTLKPLFPTNRCGDGMEVGDAGVNRALHCKLTMQKVRLTLVEVLFDGLLISVSVSARC